MGYPQIVAPRMPAGAAASMILRDLRGLDAATTADVRAIRRTHSTRLAKESPAIVLAIRDDMVVKALSWALRELAKRDAAAVATFVRRHAARLAPRVRREVRNKLETGRKVPKRART